MSAIADLDAPRAVTQSSHRALSKMFCILIAHALTLPASFMNLFSGVPDFL